MKRVIEAFLYIMKQSPSWIKRYYAFYTLVTIINDFAFALLPFIFKRIIDGITVGHVVWQDVRLYALITVIAYASIRTFSAINVRVSACAVKLWRDKIFSAILRMNHSEWKKEPPGYWQGVLSQDTDRIADAYHDFVYTIPAEMLVVIFMTSVVFYFNWYVGILLVISVFLSFAEVKLKDKLVVPAYYDLAETRRKVQASTLMIVESVEGIRHYAELERVFLLVESDLENYRRISQLYAKRNSVVEGLMHGAVEVIRVLAIVVAMYGVLTSRHTMGTAILIALMIEEVLSRFSTLIGNIAYLQSIAVHLEKIKRTIETPHMKDRTQDYFEELSVNDLYIGRLKGVSFSVKKGEKVAVVGPSGVGKSMLINVIMGRTSPLKGSVSVQPENAKIVILSQFPKAFSRSVRENLLMANPSATRQEIEKVLKTVHLDGWLEKSAEGMSGGETSRLALARVLLSPAPLIIMDEPLTGVDKETKGEILKELKRYIMGKTLILISHDEDIVKSLTSKVVKFDARDA